MDKIIEFFNFLNDNILQPIVMILILGVGILLAIKMRFLQVRKFAYSCSMTVGKSLKASFSKNKIKEKNKISPFAAFATAIAGTVGVGNIVGVATALTMGGPGAIFWMWVSAFFGMLTKYSETVLGIFFRKKNENGEYRGGAMYYISRGNKLKWLATIFAIFCVFASFGFCLVQSNSISSTIVSSIDGANPDVWNLVIGIIVALIVGLVIMGGIKRISSVASYIVPFMALLFISLALIIIGMNIENIPNVFKAIFQEAFSFKSAGSGITGFVIAKAMRYGIARGIFSNEAGLGSSVMAHASADVKEPVEQGFWGIFEVFLDTIVICTLTALLLMTSGAYGTVNSSGELLTGAEMGLFAFKDNLGTFGVMMFALILPLFAFTTIVSWSYYGETAIEYLLGKKAIFIYKIIFIVLIVVGSIVELALVWVIADTFNVLMAIPNLIALVMMSGLITKITKNYFARKKGINVKPLLNEEDILEDI